MLAPESPARLLSDAKRARRHLRRLTDDRDLLEAALEVPNLTISERGRIELKLAAVRGQIAQHERDRDRALDAMRLIDVLSSCAHTRPHERPRTHRRIDAPELWR